MPPGCAAGLGMQVAQPLGSRRAGGQSQPGVSTLSPCPPVLLSPPPRRTMPAKKRNTPKRMVQSMVRKTWPTTKVHRKLDTTAAAVPACAKRGGEKQPALCRSDGVPQAAVSVPRRRPAGKGMRAGGSAAHLVSLHTGRQLAHCLHTSRPHKQRLGGGWAPRKAPPVDGSVQGPASLTERVSRGWISEGTSQPRGPQDQAKPAMNKPAGGRGAGGGAKVLPALSPASRQAGGGRPSRNAGHGPACRRPTPGSLALSICSWYGSRQASTQG